LRVYEGSKKTNQQGMRYFVRQCWIAVGNSGSGREDLLADCGYNSFQWTEWKITAVCGRAGDGERQGLQPRRVHGDCDRKVGGAEIRALRPAQDIPNAIRESTARRFFATEASPPDVLHFMLIRNS
jgi:hypothetical protein